MKAIKNTELLKKLQPYIKDMKTEYYYTDWWIIKWCNWHKDILQKNSTILKTLTLEEAYNLLLDNIGEYWSISIWKNDTDFFPINWEHCINYIWRININKLWEMLNYLIDNNLLWTKNKW